MTIPLSVDLAAPAAPDTSAVSLTPASGPRVATTRFVVVPATKVAQVQAQVFARTGLVLGQPMLEDAGVLNPRAAWVHTFDQDDVADLATLAAANGVTLATVFKAQLPLNWRYPVIP